jgi:hypothetical protein
MRHFGSSLTRSIGARAGRRAFPTPAYAQEDVGYPYFYGTPAPVNNYSFNYTEPTETSKQDVAVEGIRGGAHVLSTGIASLFDFKKAKLGVQPGGVAPVSYDSGGGGSKTGIIIGVVALLGLGAVAIGFALKG